MIDRLLPAGQDFVLVGPIRYSRNAFSCFGGNWRSFMLLHAMMLYTKAREFVVIHVIIVISFHQRMHDALMLRLPSLQRGALGRYISNCICMSRYLRTTISCDTCAGYDSRFPRVYLTVEGAEYQEEIFGDFTHERKYHGSLHL